MVCLALRGWLVHFDEEKRLIEREFELRAKTCQYHNCDATRTYITPNSIHRMFVLLCGLQSRIVLNVPSYSNRQTEDG